MQHGVGGWGVLPARTRVFFRTALKPSFRRALSRLHRRSIEPCFDIRVLKLKEDAFSSVLNGWQPSYLASDRSTSHTHVEFPLDVRRGRFETCESGKGYYLAKPMHEYDTFDR